MAKNPTPIENSRRGSLTASGSAEYVDTRKGVQSVDQAFAILRAFERAERALALKEVGERLNMPTAKLHHYLVSLTRSDVLRQNEDGTYGLGPFALHLGLSALRNLDPIERSVAAAKKLRDRIGYPVFVAVWGSQGPTIVRYFEGFKPVTVEIRAGLVLPTLISSTGKVFLTWGNENVVIPVAKNEAKWNRSIRNNISKSTMERGLGLTEGELLPRISSLSVPVFEQDGGLTLVLTTLGWSGDIDVSSGGDVAKALRESGRSLSVELGYTDGD